MENRSLLARVGAGITKFRNFTLNLVFLLVIVFLLVASLSNCQSIAVPDDGALLLNPAGTVVEMRTLPQSLLSLMPGAAVTRETELSTILTAITHAGNDDAIQMIVLDLENLEAVTPAQANRIGDALNQFKRSGKKIVSYGDYYSQSQFHIASFADEVYMHPYGQVIFTGYGGSSFYLKDILDKFKVNVHVFRVGAYKSAVEPVTRNSMSEESRMASERLYQDLWQHFVTDVSANRKIAEHDVQRYADDINQFVAQTQGDLARAALERHLVDELLTPDQARVRIGQVVGFADARAEQLNAIDFQSYVRVRGELNAGMTGPYVDIITVQGPITLDGDSFTTANANVIVDLIRQSRTDPETGAIVLRVDSPGGSQFASELIRQELELAQLSGTPVVASFASAAASGGYWVAATADEIISEATTITGSIGIFSLLMTYENTLADFGIHNDGVGTSTNTTGFGPFTGINENMSALFQSQVEHGYQQFVSLVAKGRNKTVAETSELASGRVWSGEAALDVGLVDQLGGLQLALQRAATLAQLSDWQTRRRLQPVDPRSEFLAALTQVRSFVAGSAQPEFVVTPTAADPLARYLGRAMHYLSWLKDPRHLHAFCAECVLPNHDLGGL